MDTAFEVHKLNSRGLDKAREIAQNFDDLLAHLGTLCLAAGATGSREFALVRTKLEEACFFAKKGMANQAENQEAQ